MLITDKAIYFVTDAMRGKTRKGSGTPTVFHSLEAGVIATSLTADSEIISAALLHDVIEDAGVTAETLRAEFGDRVTELVLSETEDKRAGMPPSESWKIRKEEAIALLRASSDTGVRILFLADKLSNIRSVYADIQRQGEAFWQKFNQKDPNEHRWYYREIANALYDLRDTPAWREYDMLITKTFDGGERA